MSDKVFEQIVKTVIESRSTESGTINEKKYGINPKTLIDFFTSSNRILEIPEYQRPYTWGDENIDDLFRDIENLKDEDNNSWFLGPIFITSIDSKINRIQLLDGQQRITSIQILIWSLCIVHKELDSILTSEYRKELKETANSALREFNSLQTKLKNTLNSNHTGQDNLPLPRFSLRDEISPIWIDFIQSVNEITNLKDADEFFENHFKIGLEKKFKEGFPSALRILGAYNHIKKKLEKSYYSKIRKAFEPESDSLKDLIISFNTFCHSLLDKMWVIEIELNQANDSLKIFEGINNRGKSLSLTDKLRFKCLIHLNNTDKRLKVRGLWKQAYELIQHNKSHGFLKGENDFFSYLLLSLSKSNLEDENDRVRFFEDNFIVRNDENEIDEDLIVHFCEKMVLVLLHLKSLNEFNNSNFKLHNEIQGKDLDMAKALYATFRKAIHVSDNIRFLYFNMISKSGIKTPEETNFSILISLMHLIKLVMHVEIFKGTQPNKTRTLYLGITKKINEGNSPNLYNRLYNDIQNKEVIYNFDKGEFKITADEIINNYIAGSNSDQANFILYYYSYHARFEDLLNQIQGYEKNKTHCEHLFPQDWKKDWSEEGKFNGNDVVNEFRELTKDHNTLSGCVNVLKERVERLELYFDPTRKSQKHPKDSVGQWIGNKLVTHSKVNIRLSNKAWQEKKVKLLDTSYIKVPSENIPDIGIAHYESFDYKSIINRTVIITERVLKALNSKNGWSSLEGNF